MPVNIEVRISPAPSPPAPPTRTRWSVHQGEVCHFIVNIVKVVRLLGASSVHVSGKFAALGRVYTDWRSVWARAVAWHVDCLVHHTAVLAFLPAPNHYIGVPQL